MSISFLSAPCGAGKSYSMLHEIKANFLQSNFLLAVNSYQHQLAWKEDLVKLGIPQGSVALVSCYEQGDVLPEIIRLLKASPRRGQILIITHAAYNLLPYLPRKPWKIVIDEAPDCQWYEELSVSVTANPELLVLRKKPLANFRRRLEGIQGTVGDGGWVRLLNNILDKRRTVLVSKKQWENPGASKTIGFFTVYDFTSISKNHDVLFLAANFRDSFPYLISQQQGVKLKERLLATPLRGGPKKRRLRIEHSFGDHLPSKRFFTFKKGTAKTLLHEKLLKDWKGQRVSGNRGKP